MKKEKKARLKSQDVRRRDLPQDAFLVLRHVAGRSYGNRLDPYVRLAREVLAADSREHPWPLYLGWLKKVLLKAYGNRVVVLEMVGDVAKCIAQRRRGAKLANTTCIACGGWIPSEREQRGQHTCQDSCQRWYKTLMRAINAAQKCRWCGHGYPKNEQKTVSRRRPEKLKRELREEKSNAQHGYSAGRYSPLKLLRVGESLSLLPNARIGVLSGALEEAVDHVHAKQEAT